MCANIQAPPANLTDKSTGLASTVRNTYHTHPCTILTWSCPWPVRTANQRPPDIHLGTPINVAYSVPGRPYPSAQPIPHHPAPIDITHTDSAHTSTFILYVRECGGETEFILSQRSLSSMECSAMNTNGTYQAPALRHRRPELPSKPCTARASNPNRDISTGTRPIASGSMFITPPWAQHGRSGADDGGGQNIHPRTDPGSPASHPAQSLNLNSFLPARPSPPRTQNSVCNCAIQTRTRPGSEAIHTEPFIMPARRTTPLIFLRQILVCLRHRRPIWPTRRTYQNAGFTD